MNIDLVKEKISKNINKRVVITVYGLRNKVSKYEGILYKTYPNIFSIIQNGTEKSFSYNDYITGDIKINFINWNSIYKITK